MLNYIKKTTQKNIAIILLITIGILIKLYNLNAEDLWWDEMLSFWSSSPDINFSKTFHRNLDVNLGSQIVFTYLLKFFYLIFGYDPYISRLLPISFGVLSIPALILLIKKLNLNDHLFLILFLFLFNSYIISYEQELRTYSLIVLLSILSFIFFLNLYRKNNFLNLTLLSIINLIGILSHTFFSIIIISQFVFLLINKDSTLIRFSLYQIIVGILFVLISHEALISQLNTKDIWYSRITTDFLANFYFSRFFSSKLLGLIYFTLFVFVTYNSRAILFNKKSFSFFFLLVIFFAYALPILHQFLRKPILTDRYIIFIIIPILILVSTGLFNFQKKKFKILIIYLICGATFLDTTIRIYKNEITKPEFKRSLRYISESNYPLIVINNDQNYKIIRNYLMKLNRNININDKIPNEGKFWQLCYLPLTNMKCDLNLSNKQLDIIDSKKFYLVEINLYSNI